MRELIVAPSILSLDYANVSEQLKELNESKAKWMHFDVMDGHFVPNLTFGPDLLKGFKKAVHMVMDVHIMVDNPKFISSIFIDAGADIVTFHLEATKDIEEAIQLCRDIRAKGCKAGISVKPNTPINSLLPYLNEIDVVLIMSVEPGFGGQPFMEGMLDKVKILRKEIDHYGYSTLLEIDGGVNLDTSKKCRDAGVDVVVAGSFVFKNGIIKSVEQLICQK